MDYFVAICTDKNSLPKIETENFYQGEVYRAIKLTEGNETQYMVYGVVFDEETFNKCFKDHSEVLRERVAKLPIYKKNGSIISKTAFKNEIADVHKYSNGSYHNNMVYVRSGRDNLFGFRSNIGATKKDSLDQAYNLLTELVNGNYDVVVQGFVWWSNRGIPLTYPTNNYIGLER